MERVLYQRHISGVADEAVRDYEIAHRRIARNVAAEGIVLLKNDNKLLPLSKGAKIALYGPGAIKMIKGGTGSGDVNQRELVSIREGLAGAGFDITNNDWLDDYEKKYNEDRLKWRDDLIRRSKEPDSHGLFELYAGNPMPAPLGMDPAATDTDIAIYVISRVAGEGADRKNQKGDFLISDTEKEFLAKIAKVYSRIILVLNTGGLMDISFVDDYPAIEGIIYLMQPGMEGGNALADVISGRVTPSGKLTDTWAYHYEDYPSASDFASTDHSIDYENYTEGIYVGYRYFDTFSVPVRYTFGFGLSYTEFKIETTSVEVINWKGSIPTVQVIVRVTNIGDKYEGREVVQIYVSCPDGKLAKEFRRLVAFAKTDYLGPGMSEELAISFPLYSCTSYDETLPGYILEGGYYGIWVGNSIGKSKLRCMLKLDHDVEVVKTANVCKVLNEFDEKPLPEAKRSGKYRTWVENGKNDNLPIKSIDTDMFAIKEYVYGDKSRKPNPLAKEFVDTLTIDQLIQLSTGDPGKRENGGDDFVGSGGVSVPGSAAETSRAAYANGLGSMVLTDGPAGLRLDKGYIVTKDGDVERREFIDVIEDGLFSEKERTHREGDTIYHQYCTAFPIGTMLAQTWNTDLIKEMGRAVAEEMTEFQTALWLAPGMNIHRNPLCGRNFEYYSEDPLLTGVIAAAITNGVQSVGGCGTTIKHFACNNKEENRFHSDSRVHERALREIYLKGFEVCIRSSQPMAIMTSYNLINGIHAANSYDLCSMLARDEWGFDGMIMTDWTTTEQGDDCTAAGCMRAGNDLICPGCDGDHKNIREELDNGKLSIEDVKMCIARLVQTVWQSNAYVDAAPYNNQYAGLYESIKVEKIRL